MPDSELVADAAQGDRDAIAEIWRRYRGLVRSVLLTTLGFDQDIDDLVQEVFVGLFKAVRQVRNGAALPAVLSRIAVRRAGMTLRKRRVRALTALLPWTELPDVEVWPPDFDDRLALSALYRLLDRLPARPRLAFVLHHIQGMQPNTRSRELTINRLARRASVEPSLSGAVCMLWLATSACGQASSPSDQGPAAAGIGGAGTAGAVASGGMSGVHDTAGGAGANNGATSSGGQTSQGGGFTSGGASDLGGAGGGGTTSGGSSGVAGSNAGGTSTGGTGATGGGGSAGSAGTTNSNLLAAVPPMGWNSWNKFACNINDSDVRAIADAMVSSGMKDVGYQYVNIDDCWADHRDSSGNVVPGSNFPDMKSLADYVHGKGLKLGIYSDRGPMTCGGRPGSQGHETQDANTYAAWGIDYLKYDNCNASASTMQADYTTMGKALKASGRTIVFSICAWEFQSWMPSVGQLWRTTLDIKANWASITGMMDQNAELAQYAGPGHWNDPDMLEVGNGSLSDTQNRAHFGMWALMAAPLISGNDLRSMSAAVKTVLTASEVIAIDQDPLGVQGTRIKGKGALEVWQKKLSGTNTVAVGLLNRTGAAADISVAWADVGLPAGMATVRDVWAKSDLGSFSDTYTAKAVPSDGIALLRIASE